MLQIRKVMEHVYEKIVYPASLTGQSGEEPPAPADIAAAIDKIEILCNDQVYSLSSSFIIQL